MLTVALPLFRGRHIAWVAMESLCRQKKTDGIEWELVVSEEKNNRHLPFGKEAIMSYKERLKAVGCANINYNYVKGKPVALGEKWRLIAKEANPESEIFILQAADCYSQPWRIKDTFDIAKDREVDCIQSMKGVFYDIKTEAYALYAGRLKGTNLNMAMKTKYMRTLPINNRRRIVDKFLYNHCGRTKGSILKIGWNNTDHWKWGMDTHGLNTISVGRQNLIHNKTTGFVKSPIDINEYIPKDIMKRLKTLKDKC